MALRIADKFIEPMTREIDRALDDDATLTKEEAKKIKEEAEKASEGLNDAMHQLANYYGGIDGLFESGAQLSGLTQGIQGVTEQTADQLSGLVNSIRLYVSDNNAELKRMTEMLSLTAYNQDNPMAEQIRLMAINISSIQTMLESVVTDGHPKGKSGIRVFTDL
jgi:methyl-accepting chemotaxis protein